MTVKSCLTALLLFNISFLLNANDTTSIIIDKKSGNYIVFLSEKNALDEKYNEQGIDRRNALKRITEQQSNFIKVLQSMDSKIAISSQTKLIENSLHVQLPHRLINAIQQNSNVIRVEEVPYDKKLNFSSLNLLKAQTSNHSQHEITVAIIGNGVDYTHSKLGGSGKQSNYQQAINKNKIRWENFPNKKIIGGMTFPLSGESNQAVNYNPIENTNNLNVSEGFFPSGTVQASLILEQAPQAKILAYKTSDLTWNQLYPSLDLIIDPNQDGILDDKPDVLLVNFYDNEDFDRKSNNELIKKHIENISNADIAIIAPNNQTGDLLSNISEEKMMSSNACITGAIVGSGNKTKEMELLNGYVAAYYAGFIAQLKHDAPELTTQELKALLLIEPSFNKTTSEVALLSND